MHLKFSRVSFNKALDARDPRFDGVFYVGITTTGIYCRPICPARRTLYRNRRFFSTAAAAERAGFRPCLRCRPELSPGRARIDAVPRLVHAATQRIAAGALNGGSIDQLARDLNVSGRHLRRALQQELGVSPVELAQTYRLLMAKQLLTETQLSMPGVAYASGFQSLRRFNALFRTRYRLNPSAIRRSANGHTTNGQTNPAFETIRVSLSYRPPLNWSALMGFLGPRATPGIEQVTGDAYARTIQLGNCRGVVVLRHDANARPNPVVVAEISVSLVPVLMPLCARLRHLLDLDAEPQSIDEHLCRAGLKSFEGSPGIRVPGAVDGFEVALRAILGQQVTVKGATTLSGRLARAFGERFASPLEGLTWIAPSAERLAQASLGSIRAIGLPLARAATIQALARQVALGGLELDSHSDVRRVRAQLAELPGIGPWTTEYIVMRGLHWPDAFPSGDLVLRRAAGGLTEAKLRKHAEPWRPWRSYAAMRLWYSAGQSATSSGSQR